MFRMVPHAEQEMEKYCPLLSFHGNTYLFLSGAVFRVNIAYSPGKRTCGLQMVERIRSSSALLVQISVLHLEWFLIKQPMPRGCHQDVRHRDTRRPVFTSKHSYFRKIIGRWGNF